jgi:hypothetical protein
MSVKGIMSYVFLLVLSFTVVMANSAHSKPIEVRDQDSFVKANGHAEHLNEAEALKLRAKVLIAIFVKRNLETALFVQQMTGATGGISGSGSISVGVMTSGIEVALGALAIDRLDKFSLSLYNQPVRDYYAKVSQLNDAIDDSGLKIRQLIKKRATRSNQFSKLTKQFSTASSELELLQKTTVAGLGSLRNRAIGLSRLTLGSTLVVLLGANSLTNFVGISLAGEERVSAALEDLNNFIARSRDLLAAHDAL